MPLMANWRQLCSSASGMHAAAAQRETLLRDLVTLSSSLAADVQLHLSKNKSQRSDARTYSALATLQRLRREHIQEEEDHDDAEFEQRCVAATQRGGSAQTPPCVSSPSLGCRDAADEWRDIANTSPHRFDAGPKTTADSDNSNKINDNHSSKGKADEWSVLLDEKIHRRDALRSEVSELRHKNESAAILQEQLQHGVEHISRTAHVVLMERRAFDGLRELLDELFNLSEEWLALLEGMEQSAAAAAAAADDNAGLQNAEEQALLDEIHQLHDCRHVVLLAQQAAEKRGYATRMETATLHQQQYRLQMEHEPMRDAHRQLLSSMLRSEVVAANAEAECAALRLQYAVESLTRLQDGDDDELTRYVMQAQSDTQRLTRILALLKSIVVNYEADMTKLRHINRLQLSAVGSGSLSNGERVFRAMQQEIKTAIVQCLANESELHPPRSGLYNSYLWLLTAAKLQRSFPVHLAEVVRHALLALSALWDSFSEKERGKVSAISGEMVTNAHFLIIIGRYVEARRRCRRVQGPPSRSLPPPESLL